MKNQKKSGNQIINAAVIGFGLSGRVFHAPFLSMNPGFKLHTIMTSGRKAQKIYPAINVVDNFDAVLDDPSIDLIVICTPHKMHFSQASRAMEAGKHVVIEKPVVLTSVEMEQLIDLARKTERKIFPYHNRRWDGDFMTVRHLIAEGYLGDVVDFESHFDRFSPMVSRAEWRYMDEQSGGTLYDLGPHLVDQAITLFGKPDAVWCMLHQQRELTKTNDSFDLKLIYPNRTATLRAGVFVKEPGPRFQVHGTLGSFIKYGLDTQEGLLKAGKMPVEKDFGTDMKKYYGLLHSIAGGKIIRLRYPTKPGYYMGFYDNVFDALNWIKKPEVTAKDALLNLRILEAAVLSSRSRRSIDL